MTLAAAAILVLLTASVDGFSPPAFHSFSKPHSLSRFASATAGRAKAMPHLSLGSVSLAMSEEEIDVAIIGGGPCGLATAIAISKAPCLQGRGRVAIFEQDVFLPKGASIGISPSGWTALEAIDVDVAKAIRATGSPVQEGSLQRVFSFAGVDLQPKPRRRDQLAVFGTRLLRLIGVQGRKSHLWHDVRSALQARACELLGNDAVRSGHELTALGLGEDAITLRFTAGAGETVVRAKLVLACDGTRSTVRALAPDPACLVDEGKSVWRGLSPTVDCAVATTYVGSGGAPPPLNPKP